MIPSQLHIYSLYSGSTGNSFLFSLPQGAVLIDAGKNAKALCTALRETGVEPEDIRAIFVTHEHRDHISALPVFLKKHPVPVHLPAACAYRLADQPAAEACLCQHPPIYTETVCGMRFTSFPTPHDSHGSVGYRIEIPDDSGDGSVFRIGYATDIGYVSRAVEEALEGCDAVILESNHDPELLWSGSYPEELKARIFSRRGHLSNPDSAAFAAHLCETGTHALMLAHLSQENNRPEIAYEACLASVGSDRVRISVAQPDEVTEMRLI